MLKIALCDDAIGFRVLLREQISAYLKANASNVRLYEFGLNDLAAEEEKFFACDVYLVSSGEEVSSGFLLAKRIRLMKPEAAIILLATDESCVWNGYKIGASFCVRYENLLKKEYFRDCMDVIFAEFKKESAISFQFLGENKTFFPGRLVYVESRLHKLHFFITENGIKEYAMYGRLEEIEHELVYPFFVRTHQSFLVNMRFVKNMEKGAMLLIGNIRIPISRARMQHVRRKYREYTENEVKR